MTEQDRANAVAEYMALVEYGEAGSVAAFVDRLIQERATAEEAVRRHPGTSNVRSSVPNAWERGCR